MPGDKSRPSIPSWRKDVSSTDRKREAQPGWRKEPAAEPAAASKWSRKSKIGVGAGAFLVFNALLVWVIYWLLPPKPSCLVLIGAAYAENLAVPHNVYGWEGLNALAELSGSNAPTFLNWGSSLLHLKHEPRELRSDDESFKGLDDFKEKTVIVFLALHGGSDSQGPYLLRQDCDYDYREESRLRIKDVLERLKKVPENKKKVLILDATQVPAHWSLGMLHNDFARGLKDLEPEIDKIKNLVVLSASDVDERSWVSEEMRQSVFTHYVIEGLKGFADESPSGDRNGRVDARELYAYVKDNVQRWAWSNRAAIQTPVLLGGDRAADIELVVVKNRPEQAAADGPPSEAPLELAEAWKKCQGLQKQVPAPFVYAPHLWRQYQDTLLRYEQLARAGASTPVQQDLKSRLAHLEEEFDHSRRLDLSSAQNTLAMPYALGVTSPGQQPDLEQVGNELWNAEEAAQKWEALQKGATDSSRQFLRRQLSAWLLDRAAQGRDGLEKASPRLRALWGAGNQRPAEAHFAIMLNRDLDRKQPPPEDLLALALRTRRLAENVALAVKFDADTLAIQGDVHPYSEQVFPWIKDKLAQADQSRRLGEDRLLAADPKSWDQARQDLDKAKNGYLDANADADRVRAALQTRDEVMAALPYFSLWTARRRVVEDRDLQAVEELWKAAHDLARLLESQDTRRIEGRVPLNADDLKPRNLSEQTAELDKAFRKLKDDFNRRCKEPSGEVLQSVWRDTDDLLVVPMIDPNRRMELLNDARAISRKFHLETSGEKGNARPPASEHEQKENAKLGRQEAQRHGRMALAALGKDWFDDAAVTVGRPPLKYADVDSQIQRLPTVERWWDALAPAAEEVGVRWQRIPTDIKRRYTDSRKSSLKEASGELRSAERLARQADGAGAVSVNPLAAGRRLRVHNLLLGMAQRTRLDHWFAEDADPNAEPYYVAAGTVFTRDAKSLIDGGPDELSPELRQGRQAEAIAVEKQLTQPGQLIPKSAADRLEVTSEPEVSVAYRLQAEPNGWVPAGYPVVWLEAGKHLEAVSHTGRVVVEAKDQQPDTSLAPFRFRVQAPAEPPRAPQRDETKATLHGRFRGQRIEKSTPINLHRLPEIVVSQQQPPAAAGIAVRASKDMFAPDKGAIAIVLDCSGSMLRSHLLVGNRYKGKEYANADAATMAMHKDYNKDTLCNFHEATDALAQVLMDIPKDTHVSVTIFSQTFSDGGEQVNDTIKLFRKPEPWNPAQLPDLIDKLARLHPWHNTPLVRAMWRAKSDGFPKNFKGFKTLVVLTDGEDSEFEKKDPVLNPGSKLDIPTFINQEFQDQGIMVNIVGFRVPKEEESKFKKQFGGVEKLPIPGMVYTVNEPKKLSERLRVYLKQRLRFLIESDAGRVAADMPEGGWHVSRDKESDTWVALEPGSYWVRVYTDEVLEQRVYLDRGDRLLLSVTPDGKGFKRVLLRDDFNWRPFAEAGGWLTTVIQNQSKGDGSLEMVAALENRADRAPPKGTLRQIRRPFAWFELKPQGSDVPIAVRWGELPGYTAPAWELQVPQWPRAGDAARPQLAVWLNANSDPPSTREVPVPAGADLDKGFTIPDVQVGNDTTEKANVEIVRIEEHESPGIVGKIPCLVVRLSYPPDKPVWVKPEGLDIYRSEHRFYTRANKYTGIFWSERIDVAKDRLKALQLIALERFKQDADRGTIKMELKLEEPPDSKPRPDPVLPSPAGR